MNPRVWKRREAVELMPGSWEPVETLGDTYPAPLYDVQPATQRGAQGFAAAASRFAVGIVGGLSAFAYSLNLLGWV